MTATPTLELRFVRRENRRVIRKYDNGVQDVEVSTKLILQQMWIVPADEGYSPNYEWRDVPLVEEA